MEKKINEDFLIRVDGRMEDARSKGGQPENDSVQLMTKGSLTFRGGNCYIAYQETEATGFAGCTTTIKIALDGSQVNMIRYGKAPAHLVIEKGVRHVCHYDTGVGAMTLGVAADEIECALTEHGGTARFSYVLDMEPMGALSHNYVTLHVSPVQPAASSQHHK